MIASFIIVSLICYVSSERVILMNNDKTLEIKALPSMNNSRYLDFEEEDKPEKETQAKSTNYPLTKTPAISSVLNLSNNCNQWFGSEQHKLQNTELNLENEIIEELYVANCSISNAILNGLPKLKVLDISKNRIAIILESSFMDNVYLEFLDLSFNAIEYLEQYSFIRNTKLRELNLSNNKIKTTDWSLALGTVVSLNISHNLIENIDQCLLQKTVTLDLSYNRIEKIPEEFNRIFPKLTTLKLTGNRLRSIRRIESDTLSSLSISECKLALIYREAFEASSEITFLDVSDNKLKSMEFLRFIGNNAVVNLHSNQWICTCDFTKKWDIMCEPENLTLLEFCNRHRFFELHGFEEATSSQGLHVSDPLLWGSVVGVIFIIILIVLLSIIASHLYSARRDERISMPGKVCESVFAHSAVDQPSEIQGENNTLMVQSLINTKDLQKSPRLRVTYQTKFNVINFNYTPCGSDQKFATSVSGLDHPQDLDPSSDESFTLT